MFRVSAADGRAQEQLGQLARLARVIRYWETPTGQALESGRSDLLGQRSFQRKLARALGQQPLLGVSSVEPGPQLRQLSPYSTQLGARPVLEDRLRLLPTFAGSRQPGQLARQVQGPDAIQERDLRFEVLEAASSCRSVVCQRPAAA